nr:DNA-binding pseudobarrel domain-containing protein [Tanacetum cinerariifolium]
MALSNPPSFIKILHDHDAPYLALPHDFVTKYMADKIPEDVVITTSATGGFLWTAKMKKILESVLKHPENSVEVLKILENKLLSMKILENKLESLKLQENQPMSADVAWGHGGDGGGDDRKGTRKPNLGGRKAGRLHTRQETRNLGLKKITDDKGSVPIRFEWDDKKTLMPLGEHASHWSNYLGELIREMPLYYPSWQKVSTERKIGILRSRFGMIPGTKPEPLKIAKTGQKSTVVCRQGSRSLALLRDQMMESSATREYPGDVEAAGSRLQHPVGVPYTEEEINALARNGKQQGHLPGVGRVLPGRATDVLIPPPPPPPQCTHNSSDVEKLIKKNKYLTKHVNLMIKLLRSDDKFSQMFNQYETTLEFGSESGGCGDDEMADDEDGGKDEEDEEDGDS